MVSRSRVFSRDLGTVVRTSHTAAPRYRAALHPYRSRLRVTKGDPQLAHSISPENR